LSQNIQRKKKPIIYDQNVDLGNFSKIKGCVITDCGSETGLYVNCVESFGLIISKVSNPREYKHYINQYDTFFVNATIGSLRVIPELKNLKKKIIVILECGTQFLDQSYIKKEMHDLISQSDMILTQFDSPYIEIIKQIYDVPVYFFGVLSNIDYLEKVANDSNKRERLIHVKSLETENPQFNAQANYALCKMLKLRYPDLKFITSHADDFIVDKLGNVKVTGTIKYQPEYWELLASCKLCIDMSYRITWGRYFIEACALKSPYVGSYCGASGLCEIDTLHPHDLGQASKFAFKLLEDNDIYKKNQIDNFEKIKILRPENQLKRLVKIWKGEYSEN